MPKLYFRYGAMNSSKTANLIMTAHNYKSLNRNVFILKPSIDNRFDTKKIVSRTGMEVDVDMLLDKDSNIKNIVNKNIECILVDEGQFLSENLVNQLKDISIEIPVIVYGLRTDFTSRLFEGSKRLFELADSIEEIKTICSTCNKKATINAKFISLGNGNKSIVYDGDNQIDIGSEEKYISLCYSCWKKNKNE